MVVVCGGWVGLCPIGLISKMGILWKVNGPLLLLPKHLNLPINRYFFQLIRLYYDDGKFGVVVRRIYLCCCLFKER
jgi:hypothetical protein